LTERAIGRLYDPSGQNELESLDDFFKQFGKTMPETLQLQRQLLLSRLA